MSDPVQAWALVSLLTGGAWAFVMLIGFLVTPRDFLETRFLLGVFTLLGVALSSVGVFGLL